MEDFFDAALNNNWKEAQERKIKLPEDEPDVVDVYVQWLYGSTIEAAVPEDWREEGRVESKCWARVYIFSEKIRDHAFANAIMEAWTISIDQPDVNGSRKFVSTTAISKIYQHTSSGSLVRQFLVHVWATYHNSGWLTKNDAEERLLECPEFLLDIVRANAPKRSRAHESLYGMREDWLYET